MLLFTPALHVLLVLVLLLIGNVPLKRCDNLCYIFDFAFLHDIFQDLLVPIHLIFRMLQRQSERLIPRHRNRMSSNRGQLGQYAVRAALTIFVSSQYIGFLLKKVILSLRLSYGQTADDLVG